MARIPAGAPYRAIWRTYQPDGTTLVNATANSLTVKLQNADGTTTATAGSPYITPVNDSTGLYHQDVPASDIATIGHYQWVNTATGTGAGAQPGEFDVYDPFETSVLPLPDAKDALNIPQTVTTYDSELIQYTATIQAAMEQLTGGPLVNRAIAERAELTGQYTVLQVRQRPLVSVTSIISVASGSAIDISGGLDLDVNAGTIRRKLGYAFYGPYFQWLPAMTVNYVAGWGTSMAPAFGAAARIIIQNLWNTQRGPSPRPSMGGADLLSGEFGFLIARMLEGSQNGLPFLSEAYV